MVQDIQWPFRGVPIASPLAGTTIDAAAKEIVLIVNKHGGEWDLEFNGLLIRVKPGDDPVEVADRYMTASYERQRAQKGPTA